MSPSELEMKPWCCYSRLWGVMRKDDHQDKDNKDLEGHGE